MADPVPRYEHVDPLRRSKREPMLHVLQVGGPHPGRVHARASADDPFHPGLEIEDPRPTDLSIFPEQRSGQRIVRDESAGLGCGLDNAEDQPGIMGDRVEVQCAPHEAGTLKVRLETQRLLAGEPPAPRQKLLPGEGIIHEEADPELPGRRTSVAVHGNEEPEGLHESRCHSHEHVAFLRCLPNEADAELLQITKAAMNQLGRLPARTAREVALLDERHAVSSHCGGEGRPGADDAATDDECVNGSCGHRLEIPRPCPDGELRGHPLTGTSFPGFMTPFGSRVRFKSPISRTASGPIASRRYCACSIPIPWWWLRCPPVSRNARIAAAFTASNCASSSPRFWGAIHVK